MDPLTQVSLGAAAAAVASKKTSLRRAIVVGAVAGGVPDLDVFIRSDTDPLLSLQYHRHFTHALAFVPVIGLLIACLFKLIAFKRQWPFRQLFVFATLGALSHGLLDACTSYGTLLYLPFSNYRESWDIISIIDPLFTLPLVLLLLVAFIAKRPRFAQAALALCMAYLSFGYIQHNRAKGYAVNLATERGLKIDQVTVRPSFANTILWRIIVRSGNDYHVDAVWLMPFKEPRLYPGETAPAADTSVYLSDDSVLAGDVKRFEHFSQGYLCRVQSEAVVLGDLRYALRPNSIAPLWGIQFNPKATDQHVAMVNFREPRSEVFQQLWAMICGKTI